MARDGLTRDEAALDALFTAARTRRPEPSADFLARLEADADEAAPRSAASAAPRPAGPDLFSRLAGLFTLSGLTGAAALGVWLGFAMPETLNAIAGTGDGYYLSEFLPSADLSALSN